jgi:hypothetical protein
MLFVSGRRDPKLNVRLAAKAMERKKETAIELATIRGERIDLLVGIEASAETVAGSPGGIAAHDQDVAVPAGPLALNAPEPSARSKMRS